MPEGADARPANERDLVVSAALAVGVAGLLARALPALVQTFWIDEAGTWWLIDGGWPELVARWRSWPYQSLAHSAVALAAKQLLGAHEWALRLPSVLATAAALAVCHRLARRLTGSIGAAAAVLALLGSPGIYFALTMARPYGLGLFALAVSWHALVGWDRAQNVHRLAFWAVASVAVWFFHYTLMLGVLAQAPWIAWRWRTAARRERTWLVAAASGVALGCLTLFGSLRVTAETLPMLDMFGTGGRSLNLLAMLTPSALGFPLLFVIAAAIAAGGWPLAGERRPSPVVARIVAPLWLVPLLATYLLHALRIAALNKDRYQIAGQLGVALAVAWTVAHLASRKAQRAAVVLLAVLVPWTVATDHWPLYDGQDWRMAARASARLLSPDELVLVPSLFIEANHEASFAELERVGRWSAPQVVYPLAGKTIPLPRDLRPETRRYAERRLAELELEGRRRFSLLQIRGWPWDSWILDRYPQFALVRRHRLSQLEWYGFERRASPAVSPATTSSR